MKGLKIKKVKENRLFRSHPGLSLKIIPAAIMIVFLFLSLIVFPTLAANAAPLNQNLLPQNKQLINTKDFTKEPIQFKTDIPEYPLLLKLTDITNY